MAYSDDEEEEGEILPERVTNYRFVDEIHTPISFSVLPVQWGEAEVPSESENQVFLRGNYDNGLQSIYKRVIAWRFELSNVQPEISVLSKNKSWIMLEKPRKSFENIIRTILITVHWLHFVKNNQDAFGKSALNHLMKTFSFEPSENDLLNHMTLIGKALKRDKDLAKSKYLLSFMEKPRTIVAFHEDFQMMKKSKFIVDEDEYEDEDEEYDGEEDDENDESFFDTVCAICDNGGELLCCEGGCLRSFHATAYAGADSCCESLGYANAAEVDAIPSFLCKNCLYQQHQCFACGKLGSSAKSSGQEVFSCISATCGHFYHPECVAKLLHPVNRTQEEEFREKIAAGEIFTCPAHKCFVCKQVENKKVSELQFAMCRRCPKTYHRKCLPREISFQGSDENNIQRAWDGLLPKQILIYCLEHEIIKAMGTPSRDHLIFPGTEEKKKKHTLELLSSKEKVVGSKRSMENFSGARTMVKKPRARTIVKEPKLVQKVCSAVAVGDSIKKIKIICPRRDSDPSKKPNIIDSVGKSLKDNVPSISYGPSTADKNKLSLRNNSSSVNVGSYPPKPKQQVISSSKLKNTVPDMPATMKDEMEKRILALMKDSTSSFNVEEFMSRQKRPATHACHSKNNKTIALGLVERSVKAARTALQKLEEGWSIEDAKAVCGPEILNQLVKWKKKLGVYLAPFLHGKRYTSFGRHFTKVEKLEEIVDRLHWYVQTGDTIVDFCCGSNDFSCMMKEKLEKMRKSCSFKNYDLIPSKNDFSFEKRDWMSVNPDELPDGSQLIMGLNPPFGVKASRANEFINKALQFKPKLIVLIVPKEARRLDGKAAYNLIWEDDKVLSGKSFYLPGSVDVNSHQLEQWNLNAPTLYLWSRSDCTAKHEAIAQDQGHIYTEQKMMHGEDKFLNKVDYISPMEANHDFYGDSSTNVYVWGGSSNILDGIPGYGSSEGWTNNDLMMKQSLKNLNEMHYKGGGWTDTMRQEKLEDGKSLETDDMCTDMETSSPINFADLQMFLEDNPPEAHETDGMEAREGLSHDLKDKHHGQLNSPNFEFYQFASLPPSRTLAPGSQPRVYRDPVNFALRPESPHSNQNSSGWIV